MVSIDIHALTLSRSPRIIIVRYEVHKRYTTDHVLIRTEVNRLDRIDQPVAIPNRNRAGANLKIYHPHG